jgi:hypothetical protein
VLKRAGKQFRRSLKTTDRELAVRRLATTLHALKQSGIDRRLRSIRKFTLFFEGSKLCATPSRPDSLISASNRSHRVRRLARMPSRINAISNFPGSARVRKLRRHRLTCALWLIESLQQYHE